MSTITIDAGGGVDLEGAALQGWPGHARERVAKLVRRDRVAYQTKLKLIAVGGPNADKYRKSLLCGGRYTLTRSGRVRRTPTCKRRWCYACRPRMYKEFVRKNAHLLEGAGVAHGGLWFVTLTAPGVPVWELDAHVRQLGSTFSKINTAMRRRSKTKAGGPRLVGLRKLEGYVVESDGRPDLYVPHLHLVVAGEAGARDLLARWLEEAKGARPEYQFIAPIGQGPARPHVDACGDEVETYDLAEVVKYLAKGLVKDSGDGALTPTQADAFYRATAGRPLWLTVGDLKGYAGMAKSPQPPLWARDFDDFAVDTALVLDGEAVSMETGEVLVGQGP